MSSQKRLVCDSGVGCMSTGTHLAHCSVETWALWGLSAGTRSRFWLQGADGRHLTCRPGPLCALRSEA